MQAEEWTKIHIFGILQALGYLESKEQWRKKLGYGKCVICVSTRGVVGKRVRVEELEKFVTNVLYDSCNFKYDKTFS